MNYFENENIVEKHIVTTVDSFVHNKLMATEGNGEAKLHMGSLKSKKFFLNFFENYSESNVYLIDENNIKDYLKNSNYEFENKTQIYTNIKKNITEKGYRANIIKNREIAIRRLKQKNLHISPIESHEDKGRYYIRPIEKKDSNFDILRRLGLPNISEIEIVKIIYKTKFYFKFRLKMKVDKLESYNFFLKEAEIDVINDIKKRFTDGSPEYLNLTFARKGQGVFREQLLLKFNRCILTGEKNKKLLEAAHIKPWTISSDDEKIDVNNGILLTPTLHRMFDLGYFSIKENAEIIIGKKLENNDYFNTIKDINYKLDPGTLLNSKEYINWHQENILNKF